MSVLALALLVQVLLTMSLSLLLLVFYSNLRHIKARAQYTALVQSVRVAEGHLRMGSVCNARKELRAALESTTIGSAP